MSRLMGKAPHFFPQAFNTLFSCFEASLWSSSLLAIGYFDSSARLGLWDELDFNLELFAHLLFLGSPSYLGTFLVTSIHSTAFHLRASTPSSSPTLSPPTPTHQPASVTTQRAAGNALGSASCLGRVLGSPAPPYCRSQVATRVRTASDLSASDLDMVFVL